MTLDGLLGEMRARADAEFATAQSEAAAEAARITSERDRQVSEIQAESTRRAELEADRERTRTLAGARMQARKIQYEAREQALLEALAGVRRQLTDFTTTDDYEAVLERMYDAAVERLGKDVRISGRAADAAALKALAGKAFLAAPVPILGGLIAESADGSRRLSLSLDELLRLREDRVRKLLA
ncbi:MAG: V-type ATP synthase subunit E [Thermoplasmata archaeon]